MKHNYTKLAMEVHGTASSTPNSKLVIKGGQRIVSGITPSGDGSLHIGNYLGAVKQFIEFARNNECFLFVADLHALTTIQNKKQMQQNVETLILNELALLKGFLTEKEFNNITFFRQSDVPPHAELQSILNNVTPLGLLKRAHAYKDKLAKDVMEEEINLGLFNYPILMAADILLYKPDLVPVGRDQKQHIEITRDIAQRFNKIYGGYKENGKTGQKEIFKLPQAFIPEQVAVVMGIDGKRKMSKSLGNYISIFEDRLLIKKQVISTFTDPTRIHANDPGHIEGNMVFHYLDFFAEPDQVVPLKEKYQAGQIGDIEVKEYLFASLMKYFAPARQVYQELKNQPQVIKRILQKGAEKARFVASQTLKEVRQAIGLTNRYSFFVYQTAVLDDQTSNQITLDDFAKVETRVGLVIKAENVEKSNKLIRLTVDVGDGKQRHIFTGVRDFGYTPEDFQNKKFLFVTNLTPKKIMNEKSQGMILAVDGKDGKPHFISAEGLDIGARVR